MFGKHLEAWIPVLRSPFRQLRFTTRLDALFSEQICHGWAPTERRPTKKKKKKKRQLLSTEMCHWLVTCQTRGERPGARLQGHGARAEDKWSSGQTDRRTDTFANSLRVLVGATCLSQPPSPPPQPLPPSHRVAWRRSRVVKVTLLDLFNKSVPITN